MMHYATTYSKNFVLMNRQFHTVLIIYEIDKKIIPKPTYFFPSIQVRQ